MDYRVVQRSGRVGTLLTDANNSNNNNNNNNGGGGGVGNAIRISQQKSYCLLFM